MEQKVIETAPAWLRSTIEDEYENGWIVAALTILDSQRYMIVFQRQKQKEEAKQPDHSVHHRTGYIAHPS